MLLHYAWSYPPTNGGDPDYPSRASALDIFLAANTKRIERREVS